MRLRIISVGKKHDPAIAGAINDYTNRLSRTLQTEWELIAPSGLPESRARTDESDQIVRRLKPKEAVWLLDERGTQVSSPALSQRLDMLLASGTGQCTIIIGGAYGVDEALRDKADFVWSLSKLVFPHQIVRLLVAEQLYRATEIRRGSNYHHG